MICVEGKELFEKLIQQVQLPQHFFDDHFQNASIERVTVLKAEKRWVFDLQIERPLPLNTYLQFLQALSVSYKDIASVGLNIKARENVFTEKDLIAYWPFVVKHFQKVSPMIGHVLSHAAIALSQNELTITTDGGLSIDRIAGACEADVIAYISQFGFQLSTINFKIDEERVHQKVIDHQKKQQEINHALIEKAKSQIADQSQKTADSGQNESVAVSSVGRALPKDFDPIQIVTIGEETPNVAIEGFVFDAELRELKTKRAMLILKVTDYTSSIVVKMFNSNADEKKAFEGFKAGCWVKVYGRVQYDTFDNDLVLMANAIHKTTHAKRTDDIEGPKRIEWHLHSNMSQMDATNSITDFVDQAASWGHEAIAITDHGGVQAFPEAYAASEKNHIKMIYGVEANIVDDGVEIAYNPKHVLLSEAEYVVFDVETTGLSAIYDKIIELSAVKMVNGNIIEEFSEFIDPGHPLSDTTINLTGITDEMVKGSKSEQDVLMEFKAFCKGTILVAHNAHFDVGFINTGYKRHELGPIDEPVIDTLELSRYLHPQLKSHRLNTLAKKYDVNLTQHHRAIYDSQTTGVLAWIFLKEAADEKNIFYHDELNKEVGSGDAYKQGRPFHATLYAKNQGGLKDLFKLVSKSNIDYFYRVPRIPKSLLKQYRENLLVGSACAKGEIFEALMQKGYHEAEKLVDFYDFLEIMPKPIYQPLIDSELIRSEQQLESIMKNLVKLAKDHHKLLLATGDVHYLNLEDHIYREILMSSIKTNHIKPGQYPKAHFRTTVEMLEEFSFLGEELARQLVIDNPHQLLHEIETITPIKDKLYTPVIKGSEEEITTLSYDKAKELYGDPLPDIVKDRLAKELKSIIGNGFSVIYLIAQKLVLKSNQDGYLVGSRGSVGSSLVATMTGITEVNPLAPHYRCPKCKHSEFFTQGEYGSGFDLPSKKCPKCSCEMVRDGHDIPFETFLGFYGDKVPDIDLNFSGEYQARAHNYTKVLFGEDKVYKAGTIGTVADKTAFGYVKGYQRDYNLEWPKAETDRLVKGTTGVKRSTGQHPGGIIVIPDYMDVYDFTPIQYPADDLNAEWKTSHFDFHSIHDNVLKLDILGHDDPTVIRMLQDLSHIDPQTIPPNDPEVMKIFSGPDVLGVTKEQIGSKTGTLGIPEFGTSFVRGMLEQTSPKTFAELLQISGLSHGTDVYLGNAEELIRKNGIPLSEVIGCRDDIMVYLIHHGLEDGIAFKIMESVRKGKGIPDEWQAIMRENNIPEWYIDSCLKIKYMFPKAHAAAYVLMALRVAYFKVHYPLYYYCAYFSVRAQDFDLIAMCKGSNAIKARLQELRDKGNEASAKEKNLITVLELANEMVERGLNFKMVDINKSHAKNFVIDGNSLIAPFRAVPSLGANVAQKIVEARKEKPFLSKKDLQTRGKVSKTIIDYLTAQKVVDHLPDENQLSLF